MGGYGFITVSSGEHKGEDVFVHHSAVQVEKEQYRYLVQGEYVDFKLCEVNDQNHKWQAGEVCGVAGGQLMCETRLESRGTRPTSLVILLKLLVLNLIIVILILHIIVCVLV